MGHGGDISGSEKGLPDYFFNEAFRERVSLKFHRASARGWMGALCSAYIHETSTNLLLLRLLRLLRLPLRLRVMVMELS